MFNSIPVPSYAIALMAMGGTLALSMSYFAFKDSRLEERRHLRKSKAGCSVDEQINQDLAIWLSVNFREMGTEIVSRILMDFLMGFGAIVIGTGHSWPSAVRTLKSFMPAISCLDT